MSGAKSSSSPLVTADAIGSFAVVFSGLAAMLYVIFLTFGGAT